MFHMGRGPGHRAAAGRDRHSLFADRNRIDPRRTGTAARRYSAGVPGREAGRLRVPTSSRSHLR
ncbi:hypothetical protein GCM10017643_30960 [Ancylobacter dichloromethanicus]|uniref:Uncharacterized protein n=1 Tax=Ancylobacter dichloromethanicus TaxID=518825 RepID=A0A9W6JBU3_9HYPH|nr:hypothetical protein GCM10017643_30960 [Ancylobacter dichloromethanicus]